MSTVAGPSSKDWSMQVSSNPAMQELLTLRLTRYIPHDPTDRQAMALLAHEFAQRPDEPIEIFYGGAAGGGKSDWLLMAALQYVDQPGYAAIIFRRTYQQLAKPGALIARSKQWLTPSNATWNEQAKEWRFPSGATLAFGYLEQETDVENYQSAEFQFVGFDELTHFSESQYRYLFSRLRRLEGTDIPLRLCGASNPGSRGHAWVRDRLVEGKETNRVFIPAKIADNPHLDQVAYAASLSNLSETLQMQLREGLWDAFEGLAYPAFRKDIHVVPATFDLPDWWERFEAMDYGTTAPTSWGCFTTDNEGNVLAIGLYHRPGYPSDHAAAVHELRRSWWATDERGQPVRALCYAPADIKTKFGRHDITGRELSAETEFADHGITFAVAQQDRRAGYLRIAEMLKPNPGRPFPDWHPRARELGAPRFFILDRPDLAPLAEVLRDAPLEDIDSPESKLPGEAVDKEWEHRHGHAHAMCRYALMSRPTDAKAPEFVPDDPRAELLWRVERSREATVDRKRDYDW